MNVTVRSAGQSQLGLSRMHVNLAPENVLSRLALVQEAAAYPPFDHNMTFIRL